MQTPFLKLKTLGQKLFLISYLPLLVPIFLILIYCFSFCVLLSNGDLSFDYLIVVLSKKQYLNSFLYSAFIVLISTFISLVLGTIFARGLRKTGLSLLSGILYIPHFIIAFYVYQIFSGTGVLNTVRARLGFLPVDILSSSVGLPIIIAYVLKQTPFVVFYILPIVNKIKQQEYDVAKLMGANVWVCYKTILWPRLLPLYAEVTIILVSFISTAYEIPYLLGVTFPKFLGVILYNSYFQYSPTGKQEAIALMLLLTLLLMVLSFILFMFSKKYRWNLYKSEDIK